MIAAELGRNPSTVSRELRRAGAAADIPPLAGKVRAFRSLDKLIVRQGGEDVLYGSTLALAAVLATWSKQTGTLWVPAATNAVGHR